MLSKTTVQDERLLTQWMQQYGDDVLRTCYLLSGSAPAAHQDARRVFLRVYHQQHERSMPRSHIQAALIQAALDISSCTCFPQKPTSASIADRMLALPLPERKAALLCLYHSFSAAEAAQILHASEENVLALLDAAEQKLRISPKALPWMYRP